MLLVPFDVDSRYIIHSRQISGEAKERLIITSLDQESPSIINIVLPLPGESCSLD